MLAEGVKLHVVSQVLGHSSIRITSDVYGHLLEPDRVQAAEAMGALLWDAAPPVTTPGTHPRISDNSGGTAESAPDIDSGGDSL